MKKVFRQMLSILLALTMIISMAAVGGTAVFAEENDDAAAAKFDLICETFDYWQDVTKVVIDMGQEISGAIDADAFTVTAKNYTSSLKETDAKFNYDGPRPVTAAYVSDANGNAAETGSYITLELTHGVTQTADPADTSRVSVDGAATGHYDDGARSFFTYDMNYTVVQNKAVCGITKAAFAQDEIKDEMLDKFELVDGYTGSNGSYVNYAFYKPENANNGKKHPLMIWFHGMGEGGNPSGKEDGSTIDNGIQLYANRALAFADEAFQDTMDGAYFLAPQCPETWGIFTVGAANFKYAQTVKELIEEITANNNIDTNRIYVGGLSMGGKMTLEMVIRYPEMFAGVIGSSCAASLNAEQAAAVKDLPFWFVTSAKDFCHSYVMTSYNNLIAAGATDVHLTDYPEVTEGDVQGPFVWDGVRYSGHDGGWIPVYNNDPKLEDGTTIFSWLAGQERDIDSTVGAFNLVSECFEYWQDITKVVINMGQEISGDVDPAAFSVSAKNYTTSTKAGDEKFNYDGPRPIIAAYVSDINGNAAESGNYITLELTRGVTQTDDYNDTARYSIDGAATGHYDDGNLKFWRYDMNYTVVQNEAVAGVKLDSFVQFDIKDDQLDQFELSSFTGSNGRYINYGFYAPENANDGKDHPLMVWFHGFGERGTVSDGIQLYANRAIAFAGDEFQKAMDGAYFLSAQTPDFWWTAGLNASTAYTPVVMELIEKLIAENNIDADRIYVGGLSAGGYMASRTLLDNPDYFAGAILAAPAYGFTEAEAATLKDLPVWIVVSTEDKNCYRTASQSHNSFQAVGATAEHYTLYTAYTEGEVTGPFVWDNVRYTGHDGGWIMVYNNQPTLEDGTKIFDWLAAQKKAYDKRPGAFNLVSHIYEYWQDVIALQVNLGTEVDASAVDMDTFKVHLLNTSRGWFSTTTVFDGDKTLTDVYVCDADGNRAEKGQYVMIEMLHGVTQTDDYNDVNRKPIEGACTAYYAATGGGFSLCTQQYTVTQNKEIEGVGVLDYEQYGIVDEEFDKWEIGSYVSENPELGRNNKMNYAFFEPENANDGKDHPLFIFFHGGGEGSAVSNGIQLYGNRAVSFSYGEFQEAMGGAYVIAAQCPGGIWGSFRAYPNPRSQFTDVLEEMIDVFTEKYNVDTDRIYIGGLSMGGLMTLSMAIDNPEKFAGAIAMAPAHGMTDAEAALMKNFPIWYVYSSEDATCTPDTMAELSYNKLTALGSTTVKRTVYGPTTEGDVVGPFVWDGIRYSGHDGGWIPVYSNDPSYTDENGNEVHIFQWLAAQNLKNNKIDYVEANTDVCKPNEEVLVTVVSKSDSAKFYNEAGNGIFAEKVSQSSSAGVSEGENYLANFDYNVAVYSLKVATKGQRTITVVTGDGEKSEISLCVTNNVAVDDSTPAVISVEASTEKAAINEDFTITVVTSTGTGKVGVFNERGVGVGKSTVSKVVGGDKITWTFKLNVSTKGTRTFTVKAADSFGNWTDGGKDFAITINK